MEDRTLTNLEYCIARAIQAPPEEYNLAIPTISTRIANRLRLARPYFYTCYEQICPKCHATFRARTSIGVRVRFDAHVLEHRREDRRTLELVSVE